MENLTPENLLYEIEEKITEAKESKKNLLGIDKNHPDLPPLNERIGSLVLIKSELIRENKSKVYHLTVDEEIDILNKMAEKRKQNIKDYSDNGRPELAQAEHNELLVLQEFLPKMPSEEEIKEFISTTIDTYAAEQGSDYALSMKDMGKIKPLVAATFPTINGSVIKDVLMTKINGK
jgi:uncharacterized protein YqeY